MNDDARKALREQVAKIEAERAAKLEAAEAARELAELQGKVKLAEIEQQHGIAGRDFGYVFSEKTGAMVAVKTPPEAQWSKLQQAILDDEVQNKDLVELIYSTLLYPDKPGFEAICEKSPGMIGKVVGELTRLAEAGSAKRAKK